MQPSRSTWLRSRPIRSVVLGGTLFCLCCLALSLLLWFLLYGNSNHPGPSEAPTMQIDMGFDAAYRSDYWTPIHVTIKNSGPAFNGTLAVQTYSGSVHTSTVEMSSPWSFEQPVSLPQNSQKQLTLYAPHYFNNLVARGFMATLRNKQGQQISSQTSAEGTEIKPGNLFVGILSDSNADFQALDKVILPNQTNSLARSTLKASNMPSQESVLENFDIIVLDNFPSATLNNKQIAALRTWVNRGGILIEVGGTNWQRTLDPLPANLVPVNLHGIALLPSQTHLLPITGPAAQPDLPRTDILTDSLIISTATTNQQSVFSTNETILSTDRHPLIVEAHQGSGSICYLAFDPAAPPLDTWPGTPGIWQAVLTHALGNALLIPNTAENYDSGPGQFLLHAGILSLVEPAKMLAPWFIGSLLLGYILVLGPIRLYLQHRLRLPAWWIWRLVVCSILLFSLLAYGMAMYQKGASLMNNSISIIQLNQDGSTAHVTTYMGLFLPDQGDFNLQFAGESLTQPISAPFLVKNPAVPQNNDASTTITSEASQTNLLLHSSGRWSLNPIIAEQDRQLQGTLTTHVTLLNNRLVGSLTNTLKVPLSDLYIAFPHSFVAIGDLGAGETRLVNLPVYSAPVDTAKTLSSQISEYNGMTTSNRSGNAKKSIPAGLQNHMRLLSALSGSGFTYDPCSGSCRTHAIANKGNIYITGGQVPNPNLKNDYDPLLIAGAPATLLGWADQPLDNLANGTVNGSSPSGQHTDFIQMPITLNFTGLLHVPTDFITGHIVDVQSYDAAAVLPGIFSLSTGNVTFELTLPDTSRMYVSKLTITVPDLVAHPSGPDSGSPAHVSTIQTSFYNWQTGQWQPLQLLQDSLSSDNLTAYAGPQGRILVQISSRDTSQIYFGKPTLTLNGIASESNKDKG